MTGGFEAARVFSLLLKPLESRRDLTLDHQAPPMQTGDHCKPLTTSDHYLRPQQKGHRRRRRHQQCRRHTTYLLFLCRRPVLDLLLHRRPLLPRHRPPSPVLRVLRQQFLSPGLRVLRQQGPSPAVRVLRQQFLSPGLRVFRRQHQRTC